VSHDTNQTTKMKSVQNILFLCNHNSARSQMAEALLKARGFEHFKVFSAGLEPRPVSDDAIAAMKEIGIDISGNSSKSTKEFMGREIIHQAIFLCSDAEPDCPRIYPFANHSQEWRIPSPDALAEKMGATADAYREVRELISGKITAWLEEMEKGALSA